MKTRDELAVMPIPPFQIGDCKYEAVLFCFNNDRPIDGHTLIARAEKMGAKLYDKKEERWKWEFIFRHQHEIPSALDDLYIVCVGWQESPNSVVVLGPRKNDGRTKTSSLLMELFPRNGCVLRPFDEDNGPQAA